MGGRTFSEATCIVFVAALPEFILLSNAASFKVIRPRPLPHFDPAHSQTTQVSTGLVLGAIISEEITGLAKRSATMDRICPIRQPGFEKLKVNNCREKRCSQRVLKINMRKSYHASRITDRSRSYRRENRSDLLQKQQHGDYDVTETLEA